MDIVSRPRESGENSDSIMLEILNSARDNAQRKALSKEGKELELLNQRTRFFELSIVQFEYAIKRVQEEIETSISGHDDELLQQELSDLLDRRDDMRGRLEESEMIIARKDCELMRMKVNEGKLRSAFEAMGKEVETVIKDCEKSDLHDRNSVINVENNANDLFGEVMKIRKKLEDERRNLKVNLGKLKHDSLDGEIDFDADGIKTFCGLYNVAQVLMELEEMISDLSILEGNIKSSFEMMESSSNLFKRKLEEEQLVINYEREILDNLLKKYIREIECRNKNFEAMVLNSVQKESEKLDLRNESLDEQKLIMDYEREMLNIILKNFICEIKLISRQNENCLHGVSIGLNSVKKENKNLESLKEPTDDPIEQVGSKINEWNIHEEQIFFKNFVKEEIDRVAFSEIIKDWINEFKRNQEDINFKSCVTEEIDCILFSEIIQDWTNELNIKNFVKEEIDITIFGEIITDWIKEFKRSKEEMNFKYFVMEEIDRAVLSEIFKDRINEWKINQEDMNLKNYMNEEIDRILFSEIIKERINEQKRHKEDLDIKSSMKEEIDCTIFREIINARINEINMNNETTNFKNNMKEEIDPILFGEIIKDMINELEMNKKDLGIKNSLKEEIDCVVFREIIKDIIRYNSGHELDVKKNELQEIQINLCTKLSQCFVNFETWINIRTGANVKWLEDINYEIGIMAKEIISLKIKESLYRNAFLRRCYDLQTAETEVDLLGDEVDMLLGLIKKTYIVLNHHLPILQNHTEFMEILNVLKHEVEAEQQ